MNKDNNKVFNNIESVYITLYGSIDKINKNILNFYYEEYKRLEKELEDHVFLEPSHIFKNKYTKWLEKKKKIEKEKLEVLEKISNELKNL